VLLDVRHESSKTRLDHYAGILDFSFADSGTALVSLTKGGRLQRWNLDTAQLAGIVEFAAPDVQVSAARFSPGGRFLYASTFHQGTDETQIWDLDCECVLSDDQLHGVRFMPAAGLAVGWGAEGQLALIDLATGASTRTTGLTPANRPMLTPSPDGRQLLIQESEPGLVLAWNPLSRRDAPVFAPEEGWLADTFVDPSGEHLLALVDTSPEDERYTPDRHYRAELWALSENGLPLARPLSFDQVRTAASNADGSHFAFALQDGTVEVWHAGDLERRA
jgi:WD40 repeat protein